MTDRTEKKRCSICESPDHTHLHCYGTPAQRTKETDLVPAWAAQPLIERLKTCRVMLYQHGLLTDSECARIDQRIDKREAMLPEAK